MIETKKATDTHGSSLDKPIISDPRPLVKYPIKANGIPEELQERKQWVLWRYEWLDKEKKWSKVPMQTNNKKAISTDPRTWSTFDSVMSTYQKGNHDGIGYVFSANDPYCGIDYDKIFNDAGQIQNDLVNLVLNTLDSYTEYSPSGKGLHTIIKARKTGKINKVEPFECYDQERYFTFTGELWPGSGTDTIEERQETLEWFESELLKLKESRKQKPGPKPGNHRPTPSGERPKLTDDEIILKATNQKDGFKFLDLYEGRNLSADESANELALCNYLAFYTDDINQMDRIVRSSELYREKWEREDYAERTMQKAIEECTTWYTGKKTGYNNLVKFPQGRMYEGFNIPEGYDLNERGIFRMVERKDEWFPKQIAQMPIVITRLAKNIQTHTIECELAAIHFGKTITARINRADMANAKTIIQLAAHGFPVMSSNAAEVSSFLMAFEAANTDILSVDMTSNQMGWINGGKCFLLGSTVFGDNPYGLTFTTSGEGEKHLLEAIGTGGTLAGWLEAISLIKEHPKARVALYTAFVTPLLELLKCPNFVIDFANRTSTGKTTVQRLVASTYGNPDERSGTSIVGTWDATKVWIERYAATMNGLPVILDDTKRAKNTQDINDIIYMVTSGKERGRGNVKSTNIIRSFRTVLISSGEAPATSYKGRNNDSNGGAKGRTLTIKGAPFEGPINDTRETVQRLNGLLMLNYGHAMPLFLSYLTDNRHMWDQWRQMYQIEKDKLAKETTEAVAIRLAEYGAAIRVAAKLVHEALAKNGTPLPFECLDPFMAGLWERITREAADATKENEAIEMLQSWVTANNDKFDVYSGHRPDGLSMPIGGWYGKHGREETAIYGHHLEKWFKDMGYSKEELLYQWRESGRIIPGKDGKTTKQVKIEGKNTRMYCFNFDGVTE